MRKSLSLSAILTVGALTLTGCMTSPLGGMGGPFEAALGSVLGAGQQGSGNDFQRAAVNACGNHASQYGQVSIQDIRQQSRDTLRVYGMVGSNYGSRNFGCSFRSDGRITDFDI